MGSIDFLFSGFWKRDVKIVQFVSFVTVILHKIWEGYIYPHVQLHLENEKGNFFSFGINWLERKYNYCSSLKFKRFLFQDVKSIEKVPDPSVDSSVLQFVPSIRSGSFADIGPRRYMEDEHIRIDDLSSHMGSLFNFPTPSAFYGVIALLANVATALIWWSYMIYD